MHNIDKTRKLKWIQDNRRTRWIGSYLVEVFLVLLYFVIIINIILMTNKVLNIWFEYITKK